MQGDSCIALASEMVRRQALFLGDLELQQLLHIIRYRGCKRIHSNDIHKDRERSMMWLSQEYIKNVLVKFGLENAKPISNAAAFIFKPTLEITAEEFSFVMATNLESAYHLSQLAHPLLKASEQGNIVFISSTAGLVGSCAGTVYAASKGALNQLTKNLACEWAKDNIRTNCVAPWVTKTPLIEDLLANKELVDEMITRTPLRRFAEPKEVSSLVAFLCLPVASYINGQVIAVDGGFTINGFYPSKDYY